MFVGYTMAGNFMVEFLFRSGQFVIFTALNGVPRVGVKFFDPDITRINISLNLRRNLNT